MDEHVKVYCTDGHEGSNDALLASALGNGANGMWNNPFVYLVWMMFAGRMWGNGYGENGGSAEVERQLQSLRTQMQDNQNSGLLMDAIKGNSTAINQLANTLNCDFGTLNSAICDVRAGIDKLSGQVGFSAERVINAVNMGDCHVTEALQRCCCDTQKELLRMQGAFQLQMCEQTHTLSGGQRDLQVAIDKGIATSAYERQKQTCDIISAGKDNTQRIVDVLNTHWNGELAQQNQDLKFKLSQKEQNEYIAKILYERGGYGLSAVK